MKKWSWKKFSIGASFGILYLVITAILVITGIRNEGTNMGGIFVLASALFILSGFFGGPMILVFSYSDKVEEGSDCVIRLRHKDPSPIKVGFAAVLCLELSTFLSFAILKTIGVL